MTPATLLPCAWGSKKAYFGVKIRSQWQGYWNQFGNSLTPYIKSLLLRKTLFRAFNIVGPKTEPADQPLETPAPTSPLRPIKAEEHYLRRQLSQSHRAQRRITEDLSLLMAEGDKFWYLSLYTSPSPRDGLLSRMPSSA